MTNVPLPPGLGVMPSVFGVNKIYHDFDLTYKTISGKKLLTQAVYYDVNAATIATVDITYTTTLEPIYKGHELKGHAFNVFTAAFELVTSNLDPSNHTLVDLKTIELLGLTTANMLTDNSGYDLITTNSGELIFSPSIG